MKQPMPNAFTVDLEEWYQGLTSTNPQVDRWPALESRVVAATDQLLALLAEFKVKATFFVLGHVADHHPALIERVAADGHEIAVHGYYHKFVYKLTPDTFTRELEMSVAAVERITGERPIGHRAPYFSINGSTPWAFTCLRAQGFQYDSSVFPTRNMLYGFPGAPRTHYRVAEAGLIEFPASTIRVAGVNWPIAGGFYVRTLPYALIGQALRRLQQAGEAAVMYVHPWELDTGQTYRQVTARERLTHYHGRRSLRGKLARMFSEFEFTTLAALYAQVQERAPVIAHEAIIARASGTHSRARRNKETLKTVIVDTGARNTGTRIDGIPHTREKTA